jgi:hypothetical protein
MQLLRGVPGRRRLSGVRLRRPQLGHRIHQRDQIPGQRTRARAGPWDLPLITYPATAG